MGESSEQGGQGTVRVVVGAVGGIVRVVVEGTVMVECSGQAVGCTARVVDEEGIALVEHTVQVEVVEVPGEEVVQEGVVVEAGSANAGQ